MARMGRPHRIDVDGAWHHVMNRGAGRRTVFHTAADGRRFLELVGEGCERTGIRVGAYCLMGNHFHLLVGCPDGGLSDFMHRLGSMYTRYINDRLDSDGPIFRSRFHSLLVDDDDYLTNAARYIHRNPLDVRPPVALDQYRWSSYRCYVTNADRPPWLSTSEVLAGHRGPGDYRRFVEGDQGPTGSIAWAIETALLEADDGAITTPSLGRSVLLAMLERSGDLASPELEAAAAFPSRDARSDALRRVRKRLATHPELGVLAERALRLAT